MMLGVERGCKTQVPDCRTCQHSQVSALLASTAAGRFFLLTVLCSALLPVMTLSTLYHQAGGSLCLMSRQFFVQLANESAALN